MGGSFRTLSHLWKCRVNAIPTWDRRFRRNDSNNRSQDEGGMRQRSTLQLLAAHKNLLCFIWSPFRRVHSPRRVLLPFLKLITVAESCCYCCKKCTFICYVRWDSFTIIINYDLCLLDPLNSSCTSVLLMGFIYLLVFGTFDCSVPAVYGVVSRLNSPTSASVISFLVHNQPDNKPCSLHLCVHREDRRRRWNMDPINPRGTKELAAPELGCSSHILCTIFVGVFLLDN